MSPKSKSLGQSLWQTPSITRSRGESVAGAHEREDVSGEANVGIRKREYIRVVQGGLSRRENTPAASRAPKGAHEPGSRKIQT